jgi:SAM-dependent methyltransferase
VLDHKKKEELIGRFDKLAGQREAWIGRNKYYYEDQARYYRFLVPEGLSVLELGCGTSDLLHALKPRRGVGVDFSGEMIRIAREKYPDLEFREADIENLESWGETFDVLILADVVGHLQDIEETLRSLRSFCHCETRVMVSYYSFLWEPVLKLGEWLGEKMPQQHQNWLSTEDISNLLRLAGYEEVKTEYRLLVPKRIPWLSNFVNRFIAPLPGIRRFVCAVTLWPARQA